LLEKFQGTGNLEAFLTRTALNRLIDFKRRQRFVGQLPGQGDRDSRDGPTDAFDQLPGKATDENSEDALIDLLRGALIQTFARCDPEDLLILRLVGVFGVSQERVAKMWNCSQSKISRIVSNLEGRIQEETLAEIRRADPWLELEWADFVRLCQSSSEIFRINEPFP
ncbi:MAG: sigma-70 family RNA polymerase sigma factor, partial [Verrucomicrobiales bacterium]